MFKTKIGLLVIILCFTLVIPAHPVEFFYQAGTSSLELYDEERIESELGLNLSGGLKFESVANQLSISGSLSDISANTSNLKEHLSLSCNLDLREELTLTSSWQEEQMNVGVRTSVGIVDISASTGWNPTDWKENYQQISFSMDKNLTERLQLSLSTDWQFEDFSNVTRGTASATISGSFEMHGGQVLNTSIKTSVFRDKNGDGSYTGGEAGVSGVKLSLIEDGKVIESRTTSGGGTCNFGELPPGNYQVVIELSSLPDRFEFTTEKTQKIELYSGEIAEVRFGVQKEKIEEKVTYMDEL